VPLDVDIELYIIPAVGGSLFAFEEGMERGSRATSGFVALGVPGVPADTLRRVYWVQNNDATASTFKVRTRVYATGIAPAALKKVAKQVKVSVVKVPKRAAKALPRRIGR
jgi:CO dehydrogenase/acetyl-CoA synthase alpha subunit